MAFNFFMYIFNIIKTYSSFISVDNYIHFVYNMNVDIKLDFFGYNWRIRWEKKINVMFSTKVES